MVTKPSSSSRAGAPAPQDPDKPSPRAVARGLGAVVIRNEFYRDGYRVLQSIAVMQSIIICMMIFVMLYVVHIHQPENRYFATTEDGQLLPMVPMNEPNLSTPALTSWAAQAASEVMTFNFNDYRRRLQESSRNFTRVGWIAFNKALADAKTLEMVESQRQILTTIPRDAPVIIEEGIVQGRYQWKLQMRVTTTYETASGKIPQTWLISMLVVRVSRLESPLGIGIEQWVAEPG